MGVRLMCCLPVAMASPRRNFISTSSPALLIRVVRYAESPLGLNPSQVDYADYRDVDGVQVPFRVTKSDPEDATTIQFEEIRQNVAIDAGGVQQACRPEAP